MQRILLMLFRRAVLAGIFAAITRVFGRGTARGTRGVMRGVRTINRFSRRR
jgi:hypothetical protein